MSAAGNLEQKLASALTQVVRELVREELFAMHKADPDEWIPHTEWPVKSRRVACELARAGSVKATRKGKLWLARRKDLDAWVAASKRDEPAQPKAKTDEPEDFATTMANAARPRRKKAA